MIDVIQANLHTLDSKNKPRFEELIKQLQRAAPNKEWMLTVMSTLT